MSALRTAAEWARGVLEGTEDSREAMALADVRSLRAALGQLLDAVEEADPMSGREVTVPTVDHGEVAVPEPSWCLGLHLDQHGGNRADIAHDGPLHALRFRGRELLGAALVEYPFAESSPRGPAVAVDLGGDVATVDAAALRDLAVALIDHAATLRHLARDLDALDEGGLS